MSAKRRKAPLAPIAMKLERLYPALSLKNIYKLSEREKLGAYIHGPELALSAAVVDPRRDKRKKREMSVGFCGESVYADIE